MRVWCIARRQVCLPRRCALRRRQVAFRLAAIAVPARVGVNKLNRLDKHAGRSATWIVNAAVVWLQHFNQQLDDRSRSVEFAALLSFGAGELRKKILVDAPEHVLGTTLGISNADIADHVDELAEALLI